MSTFYVVMTGLDMVIDAIRAITCRRKFEAHHYQQKVQKMKDLPKTFVLRGKQFENFRREEEQKQYSRPFERTKWNTRTLNASNEQGPHKV